MSLLLISARDRPVVVQKVSKVIELPCCLRHGGPTTRTKRQMFAGVLPFSVRSLGRMLQTFCIECERK
jgi:hypothetical protein